MQMLCEETKGEAIITTGVGQHQMWAAQWYTYNEPRQWASSGGLGSMGFGLPSALGAAVAYDGTDSGRPHKVELLWFLLWSAAFLVFCCHHPLRLHPVPQLSRCPKGQALLPSAPGAAVAHDSTDSVQSHKANSMLLPCFCKEE